MVYIASLVGAVAVYSSVVSALPVVRRDNNIGEVAVSAPNGTPISATASPSATSMSSSSSMAYGNSYGGDSSSSMMYGGNNYGSSSSSSMMYQPSSTMSSMMSYQTPSYGSGMSSWSGSSGYDSCVQQCVASYGNTKYGSWSPPPADKQSSYDKGMYSGSTGTGATHTVIVAPTQGVLRYMPFAVMNAKVGDTVKFVWGANNHTVTKSSQLEMCNKTSDAPFASGEHDKDFSFTQVVNDTKPTYFYCGTPGHCQKGMFGIINPPMASSANDSNSAGMMMQSLIATSGNATNSTMAAMQTMLVRQNDTTSNSSSWGSNMDMSKMPDWAKQSFAENVMYTRTFLAANPSMLQSDGSVDMSKAANPVIPVDVTNAQSNAAVASNTGSGNSTSTPSSSSSAAPSATQTKKSGAISVRSSSAFVGGGVALLAAFLVL